MSKYDAKIECVANRPFLYCGIKFEKGDVFLLNPNNRLHKTFLNSNKVYQLPEQAYDYVCTKFSKEFYGKTYTFDEVVDFSNISEEERMLYVRRGYVKKIIRKINEEDKISYSAYAKEKNITFSELRRLYKEKYDEYLPHHMTVISKEIYEKLKLLFPEKEE